MRLRIGRLNQRVTLQRRTLGAQDSTGVAAVTWPAVGTYWAEVRALAGREFEAAQQRWAEARFRVTIRYLAGVRAQDRLVWGSRTLGILDTEDPGSGGQWLVMTCSELTS